MSHFGVMAIRNENSNSLEDDMYEYSQDKEVDPYVEKTYDELVEEGKNYIAYAKKQETIADILAGMNKEDWKEKYTRSYKNEEVKENEYTFYKTQADLIADENKGFWKDADYHDYAIKSYGDYEGRIDEDGNLLCTYNPDVKWDWWVEGGRWSDELILKPAVRRKYGGRERVNTAKVKDIDWGAMNTLTPEQMRHKIDVWDYYVLEKPFPGTDEEKKELIRGIFPSRESMLKNYKNINNYIRRESRWSVYAVLNAEGQWFEPATTGWLGESLDGDEDSGDWELNFYDRFIKNLNDEDEITIIDCHI